MAIAGLGSARPASTPGRIGLPRRPRAAAVVRTALLSTLIAGPAAAQGSSLVAAWGFEEPSGAIATDDSGYGNDGTIGGAVRTAGRFGAALEFDGAAALVTVPDSASLDLASGMTLEAWVYPTSVASGFRDVVFKAVDVYYLEGCSPQAGAPATGGSFGGAPLYAGSALPIGSWSHLASTWDGATLRLYLNGVEVASRAQTGSLQTSSGDLTIGGDATFGQYWAGRIDEVRIYDGARTPAEIQADMDTPVVDPGPGDTTPPEVAIVSPGPGASVSHAVTLSAVATDDVGVLGVEFFVDGLPIGSDFTPPYSAVWDSTAAANGAHVLTAVASDLGGNQATSLAVDVTSLNPVFANEVVVPGIASATTIAFLPDERMLVGELTETIWVVQPGASAPDPVPFLQLDASELIGEQGLMDVLPDPGFATNGRYYVFYTRGAPGQDNHNRVSRFTASGDATLPGSEVVLWEDDEVAEQEHHGGSLAFGADGFLYVTYGDQFLAETAQRLDTPRGKILRIGSDGSIPGDNPFYDGAGPNRDEIYAYGLRNPFRMSIDPVTGSIYVGDVGGNDASTAQEEVNRIVPGGNYGWPLCEGPCAVPGTTDPIYWYPHAGRDGAVTGGFVYRGTGFPAEYRGSYFFGDYVQNWIRRLVFDAAGNVEQVVPFEPPSGVSDGPYGDPVKLVEGPDGSLYYVDIGFNDKHVPNEAAIRRIRWTLADQPPVASASATPRSGPAPLTVSFSSAGSFDPEGQPISTAWTFGDGASSTEADPVHVYAADGPYVARLSVSDGAQATLSEDLEIAVGNPPIVAITSPADGSTFRAGDLIAYSGGAVDPDDGVLPPSAFSWSILFHHDSHVHPAGDLDGASGGTLTIPTTGHDFTGDTRYEIILRATDSTGLHTATSVFVDPEKVALSFDSVPGQLAIDVDGIRRFTPFALDALIGFEYTIDAPDQEAGGVQHAFASWSDGGAQSHGIVVPDADAAYLATFTGAPASALVAAYGFDEGAGTVVGDASGSSNHGGIGGAEWTSGGRFGGALVFDGAGPPVSVADAPSLDLATGMTLEAWVYPTSPSSEWRDVIFKAVDAYYLEGSSPQGGAPAAGGTFSDPPLHGAAALPVGAWSHLASTWDGATLRLYVNGAPVASRPQPGPIEATTGDLTIGGNATFGQHWAGRIDEVRIYARALDAAEIAVDMITPVAAPGRATWQELRRRSPDR